ncbi:hypothetical protein IWZ01DRAFT_502329 [Phyllosticta capitalensis]
MWGWLIGARGSGALAQTPRGALVWTQVISQTLFRDQTTLFQTMLNRQVEAEKHLLGRELFISSPGSFRHSSESCHKSCNVNGEFQPILIQFFAYTFVFSRVKSQSHASQGTATRQFHLWQQQCVSRRGQCQLFFCSGNIAKSSAHCCLRCLSSGKRGA